MFVLPIIQLSHSIWCQTIFLAFDELSRGIDVSRFISLSKYTGPIGKIFDFKCDKNKKWQNPHTKQTCDLPDEIESVTNLAPKMKQKTEIFLNYNDFSKSAKTKCKTEWLGSFFPPFPGLIESFIAQKRVSLTVTADISSFSRCRGANWALQNQNFFFLKWSFIAKNMFDLKIFC